MYLPKLYFFFILIPLLFGFVLVQLYMIEHYMRQYYISTIQIERERDLVEIERKRSQDLLSNILSASLVKTVKRIMSSTLTSTSQQVVKQQQHVPSSSTSTATTSIDSPLLYSYPTMSVVFTDMISFTSYCSTCSAHNVVTMLNYQFSKFDALAKEFGVEKVKTIGDAYFAACYEHCKDHELRIVRLAMGMIRVIEKMNRKNNTEFKIRIGCASGPGTIAVLGNVNKK